MKVVIPAKVRNYRELVNHVANLNEMREICGRGRDAYRALATRSELLIFQLIGNPSQYHA